MGQPAPPPPFQEIRRRARDILDADLAQLPRRWEKVGDVLVVRFPDALAPWKESIAAVYAEVLGAKTVVEEVGRISGPWRVPSVRRVWGDGTETEHLENGTRFRLDVARVMFSSGNLDERVRMSRVPRSGETVVDLFAGIGYFAVPMALHSDAARVVACEANPVAFGYLVENIRRNRAERVEPRFGDCRDVAPRAVADRIVMGHFDAELYLDVAFRALRGRGTIHFHRLVRRSEVRSGAHGVDPAVAALEAAAQRCGYRVAGAPVRFVKWAAPSVRHVVVDASVERWS